MNPTRPDPESPKSKVVFERESAADAEWPVPTPLDEEPEPHPFPVDLLPDVLADWTRAVAESTQTPPDLAAILSISSVSAVIQKKVVIDVYDDWKETTSIYSLTALDPGNRKSAVFAAATEPIVEFERADGKRRLEQDGAYLLKKEVLEVKVKNLKAAAAKAKKPAEYDILMAELERTHAALSRLSVVAPLKLFVDDVTPEKLGEMVHEQGGKLAILSDEGGFFDTIGGRYCNKIPNFDLLLKAYTGTPVRTYRLNREPIDIKAPALTMAFAPQKEVIRGLARVPSFRAKGLVSRCVFSVPKSLIGSRRSTTTPIPSSVSKAYSEMIRALLSGLDEQRDEDGEIQATHLMLHPDAVPLVRSFHDKLEVRLGPDGDLYAMQDWGGKLAGNLLRIAAAFHMAERASKGLPLIHPISVANVERALGLSEYFIDHCRIALSLMGADFAVEGARRILGHVRRTGATALKKRDIWKSVGGGFADQGEMDLSLNLLEQHGYLRRAATPYQGTGRRPSETFEVNPYCRNGQNPQNAHPPSSSGSNGSLVRVSQTPVSGEVRS